MKWWQTNREIVWLSCPFLYRGDDKIYDVISTDLEGCFCTLFVSLSLNIAQPLTNWMMLNDCLQVFKETLDHHNYVMSVETKYPQPEEFSIL